METKTITIEGEVGRFYFSVEVEHQTGTTHYGSDADGNRGEDREVVNYVIKWETLELSHDDSICKLNDLEQGERIATKRAIESKVRWDLT